MSDSDVENRSLFISHSRNFARNRYVYPVLSRRAGGISIGVNLNLDRFCNFDCIYCQIDRSSATEAGIVDLAKLAEELDRTAELVVSGRIFEGPQFGATPPSLRRLNDIAFSGDGEPTAYAKFSEVVELCADLRRRHGLADMKLVLITNATLLHLPRVRRALEILDGNNGEIWAKLDAGTEGYYKMVARSAVPWQRVLENLREAAIARPIVIQSLWMRIRGEGPPADELEAYCQRLNEILAAGGQIKLVQTHTVARKPVEEWVASLANAEVDTIADLVRRRTGLPATAFYGRVEMRDESGERREERKQ